MYFKRLKTHGIKVHLGNLSRRTVLDRLVDRRGIGESQGNGGQGNEGSDLHSKEGVILMKEMVWMVTGKNEFTMTFYTYLGGRVDEILL